MNLRCVKFGNLGANNETGDVWFNMVVDECFIMTFKVIRTLLRPQVHLCLKWLVGLKFGVFWAVFRKGEARFWVVVPQAPSLVLKAPTNPRALLYMRLRP